MSWELYLIRKLYRAHYREQKRRRAVEMCAVMAGYSDAEIAMGATHYHSGRGP